MMGPLAVTASAASTPTITWSNPDGIPYGTPLGATQLNATATVPGSFIYTPAAGTVLNAGVWTLHVDFTPTDTTNYSTASKEVQIKINKWTATISWANPAGISYGTTLSAQQLNATASVPGTFVYTPPAGTILNAGTQTLHVEFTPADTVNYNGRSKDVQIVVSKVTPAIAWANPSAIAYGTPLGTAQLNATASVLGTFVYSPPAGAILNAGTRALHIDFSPTDAINYNSTSSDVQIVVSEATPAIAWSNPASIGYGTALSAAQLNATASTAGTFVYSPAAGTVLNIGTHTLHVEFSPSDAANYTPTSRDVQIVVTKPVPAITWINPGAIAYGIPLSATQLNATASVPGAFVYTPAAGTVLTAGTHTLHVDFAPSDTATYNTASKDVQIVVSPLAVTITWSNPAGIPYGWSLGATQLNATASVPGTFAYTPAAGSVLTAGVWTLHVDFTPADTNYAPASKDVQIKINKVTSTINWTNPAGIDYGTPLSAVQLNATASMPGTFLYTPPAGALLNAGTQTLHVDFTPTDTVNYNGRSKDVQIVVSKVTPTVTWATPAVVYGAALTSAELNATASVPGTFVYTPPLGTILDSSMQTLHVDFTPTDTMNFNTVSKDVYIGVGTPAPTITWGNPEGIPYGTPLDATQLNATANVPGTFVYTPAAGTVLNAGTWTLHVDFTPTDTANYSSASKDVAIKINKWTATINWANPTGISYGTTLSAQQLNATASVPGTFVYTPPAGTIVNAGTQTLHVDFTPTDTVNYNGRSKDVQIVISTIPSAITWANPADITYGTELSAAQLNASADVPGTFVYTPAAGAVLNAGTQILHVEFTPADPVNYESSSGDVQINVAKTTPTIVWPTPAAVSYGMVLGAVQLNATANAEGTFVYTPAAGAILGAGTHTLHVDFVPVDATNYNSTSREVLIQVVNALESVVIVPDVADLAIGANLQFSATATYADGSTIDVTTQAMWASDNPAAVTIDASGLATGLAPVALATITAMYQGSFGSAVLAVGRPQITSQPASQRAPEGEIAAFIVGATPGPLNYQWFLNGAAIPGATSSTCSLSATASTNGAKVTVVVSNAAGSITSEQALLTVFVPPTILSHPQNQTVALGQTAVFSVSATGSTPLSYQWQRRGRGEALAQGIPGATNPSYVTPPVTAADQGSEYSVRVQDTQGDTTLVSAMLTVTPTSPAVYYIDYLAGSDSNDGTDKLAPWRHSPGMNGCADLCMITALKPGDRITFKGGVTWDSHAFPMDIRRSGNSDNPIYYGVDKIWFAGSAWTRPEFDLNGNAFASSPVLVSSASFVTLDEIEIKNAQLNSIEPYPITGVITVKGAAGVIIRNCYIHGWGVANPVPAGMARAAIAFLDYAYDGAVENCMLDGNPAGETVVGVYGGKLIRGNIIQNVPNAIVIESDQESVEISENRIFNVRRSVNPSQSESGIVVWGPARIHDNVIHDLTPEATAVSLQSFSLEFAVNQYVYDNLVWNVGTRAAIAVGLSGGLESNLFIYNNSIHAGPTACVQVLPGPFAGANLTVANNHCISDQTTLPAFCWIGASTNSKCGSVASSTLLTNTVMTVSAAGTDGYAMANSFQPMSGLSSTVGAGTNLTAACTSAGSALCADRLDRPRPSGSGPWDTGAYVYQALASDQAPAITQQPASKIVAVGQTATFSAVAIGSGTLTFQWKKNGADIPGATSASYTTPAVSESDGGAEFVVVVSNSVGSFVSGVATLTVTQIPGLLSSTPTWFDFGGVFVGTSSQSELSITNTGQLPVTITGVTIAGPGLHVKGLPVGTILAPGESAALRVTFGPSSAYNVAGYVIISSDASNSSFAVWLYGSGIRLTTHGVILSWNPSGPDVTGYRIYRGTSSGAYELMNTGPRVTPNFADLAVAAGQTYFYVVTAVNASDQESDPSAEIQTTIPTP